MIKIKFFCVASEVVHVALEIMTWDLLHGTWIYIINTIKLRIYFIPWHHLKHFYWKANSKPTSKCNKYKSWSKDLNLPYSGNTSTRTGNFLSRFLTLNNVTFVDGKIVIKTKFPGFPFGDFCSISRSTTVRNRFQIFRKRLNYHNHKRHNFLKECKMRDY
jgi:hypothetical protein